MRNISSVVFIILILSGCTMSQNNTTKKPKILFVTSNQHTYGSTEMNTANHFAEIVLAYDVLIKAGFQVDFVSPNGGAIPIGYLKTSDSIQKKYIYDAKFMNLLKHTLTPDMINVSSYKAVYYSGGGAAMFGVPENKRIQDITMKIYENNGVISAVCHGTAGIINLKDPSGEYVYKGKKINGFPDMFENKDAKYYQEFPFSIEETINQNGGNFIYSKHGWDAYHKVDGRIITGQDPTASIVVAQKIVETLKKQEN